MKIIIVSGLSGSGKTVALHTLEDAGYFCIDNLPLGMLPDLIDNLTQAKALHYDQVAIAIDARSGVDKSERFGDITAQVLKHPIELTVLFLTADTNRLLKRFSETRRKHPLSQQGLPLADAIQQEKDLLEDIQANADLTIDSSEFNVHELRRTLISRLLPKDPQEMGILIQSFGFKNGVPADTDFLFDVRCLPNPHWEATLKPLNGQHADVIRYLENYPEVDAMFSSIKHFFEQWIPHFENENRSYMTLSIGCTGGQHRSVYLVEKVAAALRQNRKQVSVRHRDKT